MISFVSLICAILEEGPIALDRFLDEKTAKYTMRKLVLKVAFLRIGVDLQPRIILRVPSGSREHGQGPAPSCSMFYVLIHRIRDSTA